MKKYLTYREDGIVINISNKKNKIAKHLSCKEFEVDEVKEEQNWVKKVKDGILVYEKPPYLDKEEKIKQIEVVKDDINKVVTVDEIKVQVSKLIDLI